MTTLDIVVMTCAYAMALAAAVRFTRATTRRVAGAFAGGTAAGGLGLGAMLLGQAVGVWWISLPSTAAVWALFGLGLAILLTPIYLITWRVARRFGWHGLVACLIIAGVIGPPRDYLYAAAFPRWMVFGHGALPVLADGATYVGIVALGHAVAWFIGGPATGDGLARPPAAA